MDFSLSPQQTEMVKRAAVFASDNLRPCRDGFVAPAAASQQLMEEARQGRLIDLWLPEPTTEGDDLTTIALLTIEIAWGDARLALALVNIYLCLLAARTTRNPAFEQAVLEDLKRVRTGFETALGWSYTDRNDRLAQQAAASLLAEPDDVQPSLLIHTSTEMLICPATLIAPHLSEDYRPQLLRLPVREAGSEADLVSGMGFRWLNLRDLKRVADTDRKALVSAFENAADEARCRAVACHHRTVLLSAILLGTARAAFEYALDYSQTRMAFGKPIIQHQAIALALADMGIHLESARLLLLQASDSDEQASGDIAGLAWNFCQKVALDVSLQAVQILGGHGYLEQHPVGRWMSEIQFLRLLPVSTGEWS